MIRFRRTFQEQDQDKDLAEKLERELPGILNWALAGLAALREQGRFTEAPGVLAVTEEFRRESNPVSGFVEECCDVGDPQAWTASSDLYEAYRSWAEVNGVRAVSSGWFGRNLSRLDARIRNGKGKGDRGWEGIRIIS